MNNESYWDSVGYDFSTEPRYIQECALWWTDVVMKESDPVKRAAARRSWRRMWTFDIQKEAVYWITLLSGKGVYGSSWI
jgi:hypothetical protein